ncbi:unnamed protein product [Clavelina lepadiformis]|uniref:Uncharacterized protein n=1 Tax=Clavelina lepadiformis TaxID=159417 RepID=A0ABP0FZB9_CLALP
MKYYQLVVYDNCKCNNCTKWQRWPVWLEMAENKYDLLLVPNNSDKVIRQQPWYKERLKTKYIKQKDKGASSETLVGRNWILIRSGIDDFRDGKPPDFEGKFIAEGAKGISPVINRSKDSLSSRLRRSDVKTRHPRPSLSKSQICLEKQLPLQQIRRDHVDEVEFGLTQHPLALYSHLEEGMPPEVIYLHDSVFSFSSSIYDVRC